jgi:hypothetical protein
MNPVSGKKRRREPNEPTKPKVDRSRKRAKRHRVAVEVKAFDLLVKLVERMFRNGDEGLGSSSDPKRKAAMLARWLTVKSKFDPVAMSLVDTFLEIFEGDYEMVDILYDLKFHEFTGVCDEFTGGYEDEIKLPTSVQNPMKPGGFEEFASSVKDFVKDLNHGRPEDEEEPSTIVVEEMLEKLKGLGEQIGFK